MSEDRQAQQAQLEAMINVLGNEIGALLPEDWRFLFLTFVPEEDGHTDNVVYASNVERETGFKVLDEIKMLAMAKAPPDTQSVMALLISACGGEQVLRVKPGRDGTFPEHVIVPLTHFHGSIFTAHGDDLPSEHWRDATKRAYRYAEHRDGVPVYREVLS